METTSTADKSEWNIALARHHLHTIQVDHYADKVSIVNNAAKEPHKLSNSDCHCAAQLPTRHGNSPDAAALQLGAPPPTEDSPPRNIGWCERLIACLENDEQPVEIENLSKEVCIALHWLRNTPRDQYHQSMEGLSKRVKTMIESSERISKPTTKRAV